MHSLSPTFFTFYLSLALSHQSDWLFRGSWKIFQGGNFPVNSPPFDWRTHSTIFWNTFLEIESPTLTFSVHILLLRAKNLHWIGWGGCGSAGRAITSDIRSPQFKYWQTTDSNAILRGSLATLIQQKLNNFVNKVNLASPVKRWLTWLTPLVVPKVLKSATETIGRKQDKRASKDVTISSFLHQDFFVNNLATRNSPLGQKNP